MASFQDRVDARFPGAIDEAEFVALSRAALAGHGFTADNAIACVGVCRDELCRSLVWTVREAWGEAFNFSSLGGMLTLGTAGFTAAHYHAPVVDGRERYVYIVMPHIGIGAGGQLGTCERAGRHGSSVACGALTELLEAVRYGDRNTRMDPDNIEFSLLRRLLAPRLTPRDVVDIAALTVRAAAVVHAELVRMIALTVDTDLADYAVLTGVQIHRPVQGSLVWPDQRYAYVNGQRHQLELID